MNNNVNEDVNAKAITGIDTQDVKNDGIITLVKTNTIYRIERSDYNGRHYYKAVVENGGKVYKIPLYFKDRGMIFENNSIIRIKKAIEDCYHKGYDEILYLLVIDFDLIEKSSQSYIEEYNKQVQQTKKENIFKDVKTPYDDIEIDF